MARPRVYVETTIPSAYFDARSQPHWAARRQSTRRWWEIARDEVDLVTSSSVIEELVRGPSDRRANWLSLLSGLELLEVEFAVVRIVDEYRRHKLMPGGTSADAIHLALASHYECDVLATWNYKHLANPNKFRHIRQVNSRLGLFVPRIRTPTQLLEEP